MIKQSQPQIIELDGQLTACNKGMLETIASLNRIDGPCRVVSDLDNAISRTMTLEADPRYVELMISRKLQETGEFDEPVMVIPHWKKKRGRNATDIFFTALTSKRYFQYLELVSEHKDDMVLLPLQSVLMSMIKMFGKQHPIAAVIQHGRFAEVLIGSCQKIWFADRVVAFDDSEEQITTLWETVRADIEATQREYHQDITKVYIATWIDSGPLPEWDDENAPEVICLEEQVMEQDGHEVKASLPAVIEKVTISQAVSTVKDRLFYRAGRALPVLNLALILGALFLGCAGFWYQHQAGEWERQIQTNRQDARILQAKVPSTIEAVSYASTLSFVEQLWSSRKLPTYGQILTDMGQAEQATLLLENVKVNYVDDKVAVKAFGKAQAPFEMAYKAYQKLQERLRQRGYTVTKERFDTQINASSFVLEFGKAVP